MKALVPTRAPRKMPGTGPVSVPTHPRVIWLAVTPVSVAPPLEATGAFPPAAVVVVAPATPVAPFSVVVGPPPATVALGPAVGPLLVAPGAVVSVVSAA